MLRQMSSHVDPLDSTSINLTSENLEEVPLDEIVKYPQVIFVDLSINNIRTLSADFAPRLSNIVHLDLSKNYLEKLPPNFGQLNNLKHLDLYSNKIQSLPVSMAKMTSLVWLDMKDNPINSCLREVVGDFWNADECRTAAKNILFFMSQVKMFIKNVKDFEYQNVHNFTLKTNPFSKLISQSVSLVRDINEPFDTSKCDGANHMDTQNMNKSEPNDNKWNLSRCNQKMILVNKIFCGNLSLSVVRLVAVWILAGVICTIFCTVVLYGPGNMRSFFSNYGVLSPVDNFILNSHNYIQSHLKGIFSAFPLVPDSIEVTKENPSWYQKIFHFFGL